MGSRLLEREALDADLHLLDGDLVVLGVERGPGPLGRPAIAEAPDERGLLRLVLQRDRAAAALGLAVEHRLAPLPELLAMRGIAALEADVRELLLPGDLPDVFFLFPPGLLNDFVPRREPADLRE